MSPRRRAWSGITVTDQFCGAGGSSLGARRAGIDVRMALNHWALAIETHNTNFPDTDHDCTDISACDPRRYPSTDILITSPECTTHSPAGGNRRRPTTQRDLFLNPADDPATVRSRATMFDVVRFAEYHRYRIIIVENVVEATRWALFPDWLQMMTHLGYRHRVLSINSMFAHPTPQSRDRIYVVFWRKGDRVPDLSVQALAPCARCGDVSAQQAWKNGRTVGKYGRQYVYACPNCRADVHPYYYAALNAIDFSIPAERIGDRANPLRPRTMERIRYGLERYGRRALVIETARTTDGPQRIRPLDGPFATQGTQLTSALVAPLIVSAGSRETTASSIDAMPTQAASERLAVVAPFIATLRTNAKAHGIESPLGTLSAQGGHHMLIQDAALMSMRDVNAMHVGDLAEPVKTQGTAPHSALLSRAALISPYFGQHQASGVEDAMPTQTTIERHTVVTPSPALDVDDCYFRMLQPHEIGAAMAFPSDYTVLGTKRDRVKQYGNAVTPPVMDWIIRRCVQALTGERAA